MIFRNDDVSANTDLKKLGRMYGHLMAEFPDCEIINGVSLFAKDSEDEALYPELPLKHHSLDWFYDVDKFINLKDLVNLQGGIASHGLLHVDHSKLTAQAQAMSILTSCRFLDTKRFIPPFNCINEDTKRICNANGIELIGNLGEVEWRSLESLDFDPSHKHWYFHSWRVPVDEFERKIRVVLV